jgi:hypothetical protein
MLQNAGKSLVRNAKHKLNGGDLHLEQEEIDMRTDICEANVCGRYRPSDHRCAECGCFLVEKIPLTAEYCPLLLWPGDELKKALEEGEPTDG